MVGWICAAIRRASAEQKTNALILCWLVAAFLFAAGFLCYLAGRLPVGERGRAEVWAGGGGAAGLPSSRDTARGKKARASSASTGGDGAGGAEPVSLLDALYGSRRPGQKVSSELRREQASGNRIEGLRPDSVSFEYDWAPSHRFVEPGLLPRKLFNTPEAIYYQARGDARAVRAFFNRSIHVFATRPETEAGGGGEEKKVGTVSYRREGRHLVIETKAEEVVVFVSEKRAARPGFTSEAIVLSKDLGFGQRVRSGRESVMPAWYLHLRRIAF